MSWFRCFRYHKGTDFQANHNAYQRIYNDFYVVLDTTKVLIFKQITTPTTDIHATLGCFRYHKGTDFQANHNDYGQLVQIQAVVLDTTKVLIFKQITTKRGTISISPRCFRYHKGTDFQANHNRRGTISISPLVVLDTTKVLIFKQITTYRKDMYLLRTLF